MANLFGDRTIRYQAAVISDNRVLLIRAVVYPSLRTFWMIPGGGILPGESEEECVRREVKEETGLDVTVERLLNTHNVAHHGGIYQWKKTYLCQPIDQTLPAPGVEPEVDDISIDEVGWFDLRDPIAWNALVMDDPITLRSLTELRQDLGYDDPADA